MLPFAQDLNAVDFTSGSLLLINKPKGWTSFDVVNKIRYLLNKKYQVRNIKVGHAGTLDPMATGLLLIATGKWTKELHQLQGLDKHYSAVIKLGVETDTYDAEGKIVFEKPVPPLNENELIDLLNLFKGEIDQFPPAFSAIKKDGKKLYELARAGKEVITTARKVKVHDILLKKMDSPAIELVIHCGSGFYVRSLAHDIGDKLGCGGHLIALVRTSVGNYALTNAFEMEEITGLLA